MGDKVRVLSIDGGGVRGAIPTMVLDKMEVSVLSIGTGELTTRMPYEQAKHGGRRTGRARCCR